MRYDLSIYYPLVLVQCELFLSAPPAFFSFSHFVLAPSIGFLPSNQFAFERYMKLELRVRCVGTRF